MHAFLCHETNFFCVSTTSGLLHDVFQYVSVQPIPIEICYGLLRYALTFLLGMCRYSMRLWTVTVGKLSVDIHLACTCICVYVHACLRYTKHCDDFFLVFFWHVFRSRGTATSTTSSLSLRLDPTGREFPSPLVTVFDVPVARMRASGIHSTDTVCKKKLGL